VHDQTNSWFFKIHPIRTAENVEALTPLPHENFPADTPQLPFDDVRVKLELDPDRVYVANVCVDQVPAESRPPVMLDLIMALVGMLVGGFQTETMGELAITIVGLLTINAPRPTLRKTANIYKPRRDCMEHIITHGASGASCGAS
jgi:hypothetical protein